MTGPHSFILSSDINPIIDVLPSGITTERATELLLSTLCEILTRSGFSSDEIIALITFKMQTRKRIEQAND